MAGRRRRIEPKWEFLSATNLAPNVISEHYADFSQKSEVGNKNKGNKTYRVSHNEMVETKWL